MANQATDSLVDEGHFPLRSILGQPLNYQEILDKDILDLLGMQNATEAEKADLYEKMTNTVQSRVMARVVDSLTPEELDQFMAIPEDDKEALTKFLQDHEVDLGRLVVQEALLYKTELVSLAQDLKIAPEK